MNAAELLDMANAALEAPDGEEQIAMIEKYVDAFGLWFDAHHADLAEAQGAEREQLEALSAAHRRVFDRVAQLLKDTSAGMAGLHRKAKGIMAYVDFLPKRVSLRRARKL